MVNSVFLALGSNVGNRYIFLKGALNEISLNPNMNVVNISSLYETAPFGNTKQDNFINLVIKIWTQIDPEELFKFVKDVESKVGRTKTYRWGPREIDIDIILFGENIVSTKELNIPHQELNNRDFVILPLLEIEPEIMHPVLNKPIKEIISELGKCNILNKFPAYTLENFAV